MRGSGGGLMATPPHPLKGLVVLGVALTFGTALSLAALWLGWRLSSSPAALPETVTISPVHAALQAVLDDGLAAAGAADYGAQHQGPLRADGTSNLASGRDNGGVGGFQVHKRSPFGAGIDHTMDDDGIDFTTLPEIKPAKYVDPYTERGVQWSGALVQLMEQVCENGLFYPFIYRDHFTKTGSGQTYDKTQTLTVFLQGFSREDARAALTATGNDMEASAALLLEQQQQQRGGASGFGGWLLGGHGGGVAGRQEGGVVPGLLLETAVEPLAEGGGGDVNVGGVMAATGDSSAGIDDGRTERDGVVVVDDGGEDDFR
jgi:hypothetical protein